MATSRLHELYEAGVSPWIDSVSREMLETGELARLMKEDAIVGVTSNPTIFQKALATGDWYDEQLGELLKTEDDPTGDLPPARDGGHPARVRPDAPDLGRRPGEDGYVSLEVDPTLAYDREATFEQAIRLHERGRQAEPVREDPGDRARPRRDRGLHREGQVDQRDADLLARALRGRRGGVHPRARAPRRRAAATRRRSRRWRASSSRASTPRPTGAWTRSAARRRG